MENLNLGYIIMGVMILIPAIAMMFISKKDVQAHKSKHHKHA
ncbi:MAG: hypothetical protein WC141_09445 [Arcobacteraceae bacterium]